MYTISKEADKKVRDDLDKILTILVRRIRPVSVLLFGGFGKGEGSFEILEGKIRPLNDYDLYVITHHRLKEDLLDAVSGECAAAIGRGGEEFCEQPHEHYDADRFFHVDIRNIPYGKLSRLKPMQRTFELKRSPVLYGEDVRHKIRDVTVPVSDAIRLLFNKLHHLLLARSNDVRIKTIYIYKAYLDCCAALLIFENKFAAAYRERNQIMQGLDYPQAFKDHVAWATSFRLEPVFDLDKLDDRWEEARSWTLWALKKILRAELHLDCENWPEIAQHMYHDLPFHYFAPYLPVNFFPAQYALNVFYVLRAWKRGRKLMRPLLNWRDAGLILGAAMTLYQAEEKDLARDYLGKIQKQTQNDIKKPLLELYGLYYSQRTV